MFTPDDTPSNATLEQLEALLQQDPAMFDDEILERALRTVSWNPRDLASYLHSARAQ